MYVAPRPKLEDDPLFAVRLAAGLALALLTALMIKASMPTLLPAIVFSLLAGMRKAFNPGKAIGGPLIMALIMVLFYTLVSFLIPMPVVLVLVIGVISTLAYYLILGTGNPIGMIILMGASMMSVMGMNSLAAAAVLKDAFIETGIAGAILIPLLYLVFPARSTEQDKPDYQRAPGGQLWTRAIIRGVVMVMLMLWLYSVLDPSNIMLIMAAMFVTVFPTRKKLFSEAIERTYATVVGAVMTIIILALFFLCAHPLILMILMAMAALYLGYNMMEGRHAPMVYQFACSVTIALVMSSLFSNAALGSIALRITLTMSGSLVAAFLTSLLEALILRDDTLALSRS
ncbi:FUSC family protein [Carnimonas bestiolae]|uniref:FUSC family protein n=1 Tax=Carnimonas bestiolae TaxID=3402172 RepID=UPI003EDCAFA2